MEDLKIKLTNSEYITKAVNAGYKPNSKNTFVLKTGRRKYHKINLKTVPDYDMTFKMLLPQIKERGYIKSNQIIYRVVGKPSSEIRSVQCSVPIRRRNPISYIDGKQLKSWIAEMDAKHIKWEPIPKHAVEDEILSVAELLTQKGPLNMEQLKGFIEVDDFEIPPKDDACSGCGKDVSSAECDCMDGKPELDESFDNDEPTETEVDDFED